LWRWRGGQAIEDVVVSKRRTQYEEALSRDALDYDTWFDYIRLEESQGDLDKIRDVYERAIAQVPPVREKRLALCFGGWGACGCRSLTWTGTAGAGSGGGTSTCGSTTPCSRSCRPAT
jgi:hypothetical protein